MSNNNIIIQDYWKSFFFRSEVISCNIIQCNENFKLFIIICQQPQHLVQNSIIHKSLIHCSHKKTVQQIWFKWNFFLKSIIGSKSLLVTLLNNNNKKFCLGPNIIHCIDNKNIDKRIKIKNKHDYIYYIYSIIRKKQRFLIQWFTFNIFRNWIGVSEGILIKRICDKSQNVWIILNSISDFWLFFFYNFFNEVAYKWTFIQHEH